MVDMRERQYWDQYQEIYGEMISKTSKDYAPWYIVPADNKWYTRYVVSQITLQALKKIDPQFPPLAPDIAEQLENSKAHLLCGCEVARRDPAGDQEVRRQSLGPLAPPFRASAGDSFRVRMGARLRFLFHVKQIHL